jgi:hypothetical protein
MKFCPATCTPGTLYQTLPSLWNPALDFYSTGTLVNRKGISVAPHLFENEG